MLKSGEHWMREDEIPPIGLILCAQKDRAIAHYILENLPNKVMASEYITALPDEKVLIRQIQNTHKRIERGK
jgi:hypothetical protein